MSFKEILKIEGIRGTLFTMFFAAIGFGIILPILPFYSERFGATPMDLGILTAIFAFISLIFSPIVGGLADRVGRKKVLLAGTAVFSFSYLLFAFASNLQSLFIARAIEALAAAGIFPACASLISDFTTEQQRGKAMALVGMTFSLGFILGPALGGLAEILSIQGAFLLAASLGAINFASVFFNLKEPKEKPESRDIARKEISLLEHVSSPLLLIFASGMMISFLIGGLQATLALYTHDRMGFGAGDVGIVFTIIGILIMFFQFLSGSLVSRFGEVRMIQMGLFLSTLGFLSLAFSYDWLTLLLPLAVLVLGNAFVFPSVASLVSKRAQGKRGVVMGLVSSFQSLGQFIGPLLAGYLFTISNTLQFFGLSAAVFAFFLIFSVVERQNP